MIDWAAVPSAEAAGREIHGWMRELWPLPRSLTGDGIRETLRRVARVAPVELRETPSGTAAFDWALPKEWNVREARVAGPDGRRVADFDDSPPCTCSATASRPARACRSAISARICSPIRRGPT